MIGTGWIGWTYDQAMDTPMHAIQTAHKGRLKMLQTIFGGDDPTKPPPAPKARMGLVAQFAELKKNWKEG